MKSLVGAVIAVLLTMYAYSQLYLVPEAKRANASFSSTLQQYYSGQGELKGMQNVGIYQKKEQLPVMQGGFTGLLLTMVGYDRAFAAYNVITTDGTFPVMPLREEIPAQKQMVIRRYNNPAAVQVEPDHETSYSLLCYSDAGREHCFNVMSEATLKRFWDIRFG